MAKRGRPIGSKTTTETADPLVRRLFELMDEKSMYVKDVAKAIGRSPTGMSRWRHGRSNPSMYDAGLVAEYLGYEIILKPKE